MLHLNTGAEDIAQQQQNKMVRAAENWELQSNRDWMGIKCEGDSYSFQQPKTYWLPPHRVKAEPHVQTIQRGARSIRGSLARSDAGEALLDALCSDDPEEISLIKARGILTTAHGVMKPGDAATIVESMGRWGHDENVSLGGCQALAAIAEKNRGAVTDVDGVVAIAEVGLHDVQ